MTDTPAKALQRLKNGYTSMGQMLKHDLMLPELAAMCITLEMMLSAAYVLFAGLYEVSEKNGTVDVKRPKGLPKEEEP